ncbi:MAG: glycosyltransferase [Calditrichaceae bacterium]
MFSGIPENKPIPVAVLSQKPKSIKKKILNFIRLNLFLPDAKILWYLSAYLVGKKIIKKENPDLIFSSSPPPTTHLIASKLAKKFNIKWIADFRDPWSKIHYYQNQRISLIQKLDEKLENRIQTQCDVITCASKNFADLLMIQNKEKIQVIYNGFDENDMISESRKNEDVFNIVYIGGLNQNRYYPDFFRQLSSAYTEKILDPQKCNLIIAGSIEDNIKNELETMFAKFNSYQFLGYVEHKEAMTLMQKAGILLLFLEDIVGYEGHVPGKLFEYLITGNPILGVGNAKGDTTHILEETGAGKILDKNTDFKAQIKIYYDDWLNNRKIKIPLEKIDKYSRIRLTEQLAKIFEKLSDES